MSWKRHAAKCCGISQQLKLATMSRNISPFSHLAVQYHRHENLKTHLLALGSFLVGSAGLTFFHTPPKEPFDISSVMLTVAGSHLDEGERTESVCKKKKSTVGRVGTLKRELYFKFPSSGTCTMPSSSAMMLCSSWRDKTR